MMIDIDLTDPAALKDLPPVEAVRVLSDPWVPETLPEWTRKAWREGQLIIMHDKRTGRTGVGMVTPKGPLIALPGDWIVRDPFGKLFHCEPRQFEQFFGKQSRHTTHLIVKAGE